MKPNYIYIQNIPAKAEIEYIKDGNVIGLEYSKSFFSNPNIESIIPQNFDLIVFSDYANIYDKCVNKKIITRTNHQELSSKCERSNIQFIMVEFKMGEKTYKINMKDETYNYYVVGNIINFAFIVYYLMNHSSEKITFKEIETHMTNSNECHIKIIDHNVNIVTLDKLSHFIEIRENDYHINNQM